MNNKTDIKHSIHFDLTIIIPCYNIEPYLNECINSIINQEYKLWKLILIDDGSTDRTGEICDKFKKTDDRISVIHTENHGPSSARNLGIQKCQTKFVTFVDGDDFIHPQMYKLMMAAIKEEDNIDIVQCNVFNFFENTKPQFSNYGEKVLYQKYKKIEGVKKILKDDDWKSYMCNKIFNIKLFKNIDFPKDRMLDEDTSIMHLIFHNAEYSYYIPLPLYYYRHREGSTCLSYSTQKMAKKAYDRINARWERLQFVETHSEYKEFLNSQRNNYVAVALAVLRIVSKYPQYFPSSFFTINRNRIINSKINDYLPIYWNKRKKIELYILKHCPNLFKFCYKFLPAWR